MSNGTATTATTLASVAPQARSYLERYRNGEWRDKIFRDMIVDSLPRSDAQSTILDIGCGRGFDGDVELQHSIPALTGARLVGVEPDATIDIAVPFTRLYRCKFEDAPIPAESIDAAYAVMVLEHLSDPAPFFEKVRQVLKPGGVFWAMTVDARHWFTKCSKFLDAVHLKETYLRLLIGRRGEERYENYPVFYRCNSPDRIHAFGADFRRVDCVNFARIGQCADYFPHALRQAASALDAYALRRNAPGTLLIVQMEK